MEHKVIISGFGGQGIVFAGRLLAEAAMLSLLNSTYFPSYGIEMRGGAAKCDIVISDEEIGSPVIDEADAVIAMSVEAKRKYEHLIKKDGMFVLNSSLITEPPERDDIEIVNITATESASEMGNRMVATLICLGYVAGRLGIPQEALLGSLERKKQKLGSAMVELNKKALKKELILKQK